MASAGPNLTGTAINGVQPDGFNTRDWTGASNVQSEDGVFATYTSAPTTGSKYLNCQNFGFSIPTGATIDGVMVEIKVKSGSNGTNVFSNPDTTGIVKLLKAGVVSGTNQVSTANSNSITTTLTWFTFGSSSNIWGNTLAASDVNGSGFGVVFNIPHNNTGKSSIIISVDAVRITIYYTSSGISQSATNMMMSSAF